MMVLWLLISLSSGSAVADVFATADVVVQVRADDVVVQIRADDAVVALLADDGVVDA